MDNNSNHRLLGKGYLETMKYILIGLVCFLVGLWMFISEWREILKELREEQWKLLIVVRSIFIKGFGILGVILVLVGLSFVGRGLNFW